jgi:uncharacterized protein (DUF934 family)
MTRQLLRDGQVVEDDWAYAAESPGAGAPAAGSPAAGSAIILAFDQWLAGKPAWLAHPGRLGVVLQPAHKVEQVAADLSRFDLIGAEFPGPAEGRGYTQARLLRERYGFKGEVRASGFVRRDQLFFLARCGFNSFELPPGELTGAAAALATFSAEYQPANDAGLIRKLSRR